MKYEKQITLSVCTHTQLLTEAKDIQVSEFEFRHDYTRNYTIPSHPLATYALTRQDTAILSEGDGDKKKL
jgi:hypothetical protein